MDIRSLPTIGDSARWSGVMLAIFKLCLALLMLRQVSVSTVIIIAVIGSAVNLVLPLILAGVSRKSPGKDGSAVGSSQGDSPRESTSSLARSNETVDITSTENVTPIAVGRGWVVDWTVRYDL